MIQRWLTTSLQENARQPEKGANGIAIDRSVH